VGALAAVCTLAHGPSTFWKEAPVVATSAVPAITVIGKPAGVRCEHDLPAVESYPERLVPGRRQPPHRTVAEHDVLAIDQAQFVTEIEIARVEAARRATMSGSLPASHSRPCTSIVALVDQGGTEGSNPVPSTGQSVSGPET
jgi:hypothetical protein